MTAERWIIVNKKADTAAMQRELGLDPLMARLLANRGVDTPEKAAYFLKGRPEDMHDPRLLKDAEKLVAILRAAGEAGSRVAIASDFDADGVFSGQILKTGLEDVGFTVKVFTPDRLSEGYGLNRRIVDDALDFGAKILLTCDNGIAAHEAVAYAKEKGLTVLITDHHEVPTEGVPAADAVVDPKQPDCGYPFDGICGAAVAYKIICLLYESLGKNAAEARELLTYAAIATVTDVMELLDENHILVKEGLKRLAATENPGLRTLLRISGLEGKPLTAYHLGFVLGPCFNAAGRLETVDIVQQLLAARSDEEALPLAERLQELNNIRKALTNEGRRAAEEKIKEEGLEKDTVLVVYLPKIHESVAGIVAGRLRESYHRPALVITGEDETVKGSARSVEAYNVFEKMSEARDLLSHFGGHPMAAGFSLPRINIEPLRRFLNARSGLRTEDLTEEVRLDAVIRPEYATAERIRTWEALAPFGKGNEKPMFGQSSLSVTEMKVLGLNRNAVRLRFNAEDGASFEGIWFGDAESMEDSIRAVCGEKAVTGLERGQKPVRMALAYQPAIHEYNGKRSIQFQITHYQVLGQ